MAVQIMGGERCEADIVLSFLKLPNGSNMGIKQMITIEKSWTSGVQNWQEIYMKPALGEEILAQLIEEGIEENFEKRKEVKKIKRTASFDMI